MNNLFLILALLSFPVMFYFGIRMLMSYFKKNRPLMLKMLKLFGVSFGVMVVSLIAFTVTIDPADAEQAKINIAEREEAKKAAVLEQEKADAKAVEEKNEAKKNADEEKAAAELKSKQDAEAKVKAQAEKKDNEDAVNKTSEIAEAIYQPDSVANAEKHPAKPGAMLYDKTDSKFKGMNYHFKGELISVEKIEGLFGNMEDALLVKNEQGYVMPIFLPYEISAAVGDEIEVWGPLSGDGYASSDLGVDNVVGITGAMNATRIDVNGEMQ